MPWLAVPTAAAAAYIDNPVSWYGTLRFGPPGPCCASLAFPDLAWAFLSLSYASCDFQASLAFFGSSKLSASLSASATSDSSGFLGFLRREEAAKVPGLPWASLGFPGLPWALLGFLGLPWASLGFPELPWACLGFPGLPWASLGFPGLPRASLGFPGPQALPGQFLIVFDYRNAVF